MYFKKEAFSEVC